MPRFSVIIPLYNKENFVKRTLQSVLNQTYLDFEVLLINDASTDNSWEIAQQFDDARIKCTQHSNNKGLSATRNTGIKCASAPYLAFLDADDTWSPTYLETMDTLIESYPEASLFAGAYQLILSNGTEVAHDLSHLNFDSVGLIDNFFTSNLNQNIYYPSCLTVERSVFDDVGYYNEDIQFSEDVDFNIRAHAKYRMAFTKEPLVTYVVASENQITQSPLGTKVIPDYNFYEAAYPDRTDIKEYLDFQRYVKAKMYKLDGDKKRYRALVGEIDFKNLTWKQKLLLQLPKTVVKWLGSAKQHLQKKGVTITSYR